MSQLDQIVHQLPNLVGAGSANGSSYLIPIGGLAGIFLARWLLFRGLGVIPIAIMVGVMIFIDRDARAFLPTSLLSNSPLNVSMPTSLTASPALALAVIMTVLIFATRGRIVNSPYLLILLAGGALYYKPPVFLIALAIRYNTTPELLVVLGGGVLGVILVLLSRNRHIVRVPGAFTHTLHVQGQLLKGILNGVGALLVISLASGLVVDKQILSPIAPSIRAFLGPIALACGLTFLHRSLPERLKAVVTPTFWLIACLIIGAEVVPHSFR